MQKLGINKIETPKSGFLIGMNPHPTINITLRQQKAMNATAAKTSEWTLEIKENAADGDFLDLSDYRFNFKNTDDGGENVVVIGSTVQETATNLKNVMVTVIGGDGFAEFTIAGAEITIKEKADYAGEVGFDASTVGALKIDFNQTIIGNPAIATTVPAGFDVKAGTILIEKLPGKCLPVTAEFDKNNNYLILAEDANSIDGDVNVNAYTAGEFNVGRLREINPKIWINTGVCGKGNQFIFKEVK